MTRAVRNPALSRAVFSEAISLIGAGKADEAERICRASVGDDPENVNLLALLGAILVKRRQYREAEEWLRTAIEHAPSFAKAHEDLGFALLQQGEFQEASEILKKAVKLDPKLELAYLNMGRALAGLGKNQEADEAFEKSFELNPVRKKLAHATELHRDGKSNEAESIFRDALREDPNNVDALRMCGMIAYGNGRIDEAERLLRRAVSNAPDFVDAIIDLGACLLEQNRYEEAIECLRQACALEPGNVKAHYQLASALSPAALTYEALNAYERVLELRPRHPGALLGLGHTLKTVGRQDEAVEAYRRCIKVRKNKGETYWSLANLKTYSLTAEDITEMESQVAKGGLTDESHVNFLFALAKASEDKGDFTRAWKYYDDGNSMRRMLEHYDAVRTEVQNDAIVSVFTRELFERAAGLGNRDTSPIFIVGLPRSGSTLLEQILASHSRVEGTSELPYVQQLANSLNRNRADGVNYPEAVLELREQHFKSLGQQYLDAAALHRTEGAPKFIDKMPNNFPSIGLVKLVLPNAKIIDARRYPLDSCLSCYRQLFGKGQSFTYDLSDIGEYFVQYQRMMDHWHDVLPGQILTMQYEEVVTDFEVQVRRLLEFCDLPWEDACLQFYETDRPIRTASSEQVRQPVHSRSVHFWRNYRQHLDELIDVLSPVLDRYQKYESIDRRG